MQLGFPPNQKLDPSLFVFVNRMSTKQEGGESSKKTVTKSQNPTESSQEQPKQQNEPTISSASGNHPSQPLSELGEKLSATTSTTPQHATPEERTASTDETTSAAADAERKPAAAKNPDQKSDTTSPSTPDDPRNRPRQVIAVSASKGPAAFFNLARKFLVTDDMCDLSALEGAIVAAADAAHLLERSKLATIVR
jgi:hypothetical protein